MIVGLHKEKMFIKMGMGGKRPSLMSIPLVLVCENHYYSDQCFHWNGPSVVNEMSLYLMLLSVVNVDRTGP